MPAAELRVVLDQWTPVLARLPGLIQKMAEQELEVVAADIVDMAKQIVPVRTGFLRDSIFSQVEGLVATIGATADYASYVEFGTFRMGARPYLRPAFDAYSSRLLDAISVGVMNALGL